MKSLLLAPLLITGLQSPANALPWSGDIVEKNNVGEKVIVNETAVEVQKKGWVSLNHLQEDALKFLKTQLDKSNREIKDFARYCDGPNKDYCNRKSSKEGLKSIYEELKEDAKNIKDKLPLEFKTTEQISTAQSLLEEVHWFTIYYTPIFVDLNNKKTPMKKQTATCINPQMSDYAKEQWSRTTRYWYGKEIFQMSKFDNNRLDQKVCDKYAKF